MSSYFQAPPRGFFNANETLNAIPETTGALLVTEVLTNLGKYAVVDASKYLQDLPQFDAETVQGAINAAAFLFRGAQQQELTSEAFETALTKHSALSTAVRTIFVNEWTKFTQQTTKPELRLSEIVDFDWRLGVGISSSDCNSLRSPFVAVSITVSDPSGVRSTYPLEMTLMEFQDFSRKIRDIAQQLDNV